MSDLTVAVGDHTLVVRAGAVVMCEARTLLCSPISGGFWYLPGGRVKSGESLMEALDRELTEELTCDFEVVRALTSCENFFVMDQVQYHELGTYFLVRLLGDEADVPSRHGSELRRWFDVEKAAGMRIKPDFARELIIGPDEPFRLISNRDGEGPQDIKTAP
jgi:ADP-ribose pyrophosphatase YjhB (NUDIX family)